MITCLYKKFSFFSLILKSEQFIVTGRIEQGADMNSKILKSPKFMLQTSPLSKYRRVGRIEDLKENICKKMEKILREKNQYDAMLALKSILKIYEENSQLNFTKNNMKAYSKLGNVYKKLKRAYYQKLLQKQTDEIDRNLEFLDFVLKNSVYEYDNMYFLLGAPLYLLEALKSFETDSGKDNIVTYKRKIKSPFKNIEIGIENFLEEIKKLDEALKFVNDSSKDCKIFLQASFSLLFVKRIFDIARILDTDFDRFYKFLKDIGLGNKFTDKRLKTMALCMMSIRSIIYLIISFHPRANEIISDTKLADLARNSIDFALNFIILQGHILDLPKSELNKIFPSKLYKFMKKMGDVLGLEP